MINKRGNIMLNLLFFLMALAVLVMFITPFKAFIDIAQQSDHLNCQGYIYNGDPGNALSYNSSLNSDTMSCLGFKLFLPYLILAFVIGGVIKILYERANPFGAEGPSDFAGG